MRAILEGFFEQGQRYALLLPLVGLGVFLVYCYVQVGRPPSGLSLSQIVDLSLIALLFSCYILFVNFILLSVAFFFLKPIFWLLSKFVDSELPFFDGVALFESTDGPLSGMKESFEHVFHQSIGWGSYSLFALVSIVVLAACVYLDVWALILVSIGALLFGLFYAFFVVYVNRAARFSKLLKSSRCFLREREVAKHEIDIKSSNALKAVFLLFMMFYPVFSMGFGSPVLSDAVEKTGYRASSAVVYVNSEYCDLISDRSKYAFGDPAGSRCVLRDVEVLLYRIGDEVAVALPAKEFGKEVVVFLPRDSVLVQL